MEIDWTHELVDQLEFHWSRVFRPRLDGLTDEQYLWEPAPGMWSIRPSDSGGAVVDFEMPEPDPPPLTTIAWRMGHISIGIFGGRASRHFGDGSVDYQTTDWPLTAKAGVALLDHHHDAWLDGVRSLGPDGLARPCGPAEGPFAEYPMAALVLHINREALHHAAEIALLLDLYTHTGGSR